MEKKECEMVKGTWCNYFFEVLRNPLYDAATLKEEEKVFDELYGNIFFRHLSLKKGPLLDLGAGIGGDGFMLARKGFTVWGLDNDRDALLILVQNALRWTQGR